MLNFLHSLLPLNEILVSLTMGIMSLVIVVVSGLSGDNAPAAVVAGRAVYAFGLVVMVVFTVMMSIEEYALWRTKRELEELIEKAELKAGR